MSDFAKLPIIEARLQRAITEKKASRVKFLLQYSNGNFSAWNAAIRENDKTIIQ